MDNNELESYDFGHLEQIHRELENELILKRVEQLYSQLDTNNMKIFQLKNALERSEMAKKELELSLKLIQKRVHNLEEKNREISELLMKLQIKEEMKTSEIDTMKQYTEEIIIEKIELTRKVEELEAQKKYSVILQNKLMGKDMKIKAALQEMNETVKKLEDERETVLQFEKLILNKSGNTEEFLTSENKQLKERNKNLEHQVIEITAKYNKLQKLLTLNAEVDGNLHNNLIFQMWKTDTETLRQQYDSAQRIISNMNEIIKKEKEANYGLILQYEEKIKEIEQKTELKIGNN